MSELQEISPDAQNLPILGTTQEEHNTRLENPALEKLLLEKLLIVTGDPSADYHAAHVVHALRHRNPEIQIAAVGGEHLKAANVELINDQSRMARVGFGSVLGAPYHFFLGRKILKFCDEFKPNAVLLIDYGVFNLWLAPQLKRKGIRVYYFIPPQVWASRPGRIRKIKKSVDHVFCIFPFEKDLYEKHGIPVTYVGHPLVSQLPPPLDRDAKLAFCQQYGLNPSKPIVGIFPGSRKMEIDYLLYPMLQSLPLIQAAHPDAQFVLAKASSLNPSFFDRRLKAAQKHHIPRITIVEHQNHALLSIADAVMAASGTVTLEAALYQTPLVLMYRGNPLIYEIAIRVLQLPFIGLPNILYCIPDINEPAKNLKLPIAPELIQYQVKPVIISEFLIPLLNPNSLQHQKAKQAFSEIRQKLAPLSDDQTTSTAQHVANELLQLI